MMELTFVTSNKNKLREAQDVLKGYTVLCASPNIAEIQGSEEEIVLDKAMRAFACLKNPLFVDDTSLHLSALRGMPGPYTVHFLNRIGSEGVYKLLAAFEDKKAIAMSLIAYHDGKEIHVFKGESHGIIVEPRGKNFFGFDPLFQPVGHSKTYAEMTMEEKNSMSHRALALRKLREYLINK